MENSTVQICERCREANAANHIRGTDETGTWLFCKRCGSITRFREGLNENQLLHKAACQSGAVALTNYKFDDAYTQFETALKRCPNSAEAVWGMICCDYGIVMVRDFYEGAYKPIYCYADYANVEPFDRNANVVRLRLLCGENETVRAVYWEWMEKCAKDLKRIAEEIRKAPEYDVFICCKISTKTDDHPDWPGRTDEADEARTLYDDLTRRGVKVFYSEKNIKDGIEFDWQILRAMLKSRRMLIVCGSENSREFLESQWVKSEWKRWLRLWEMGIKERNSVCLFSINTTSSVGLPFEFKQLGIQVIKPRGREEMLESFAKEAALYQNTSSEKERKKKKSAKEKARRAVKAGSKRKDDTKSQSIVSEIQTITYRDGSRYVGGVVHGKKHGQGTYYFADGGRYEGDFVNGSFHGQGTYYYTNGTRYEGDFVNGSFHGQGTYYSVVGARYEGDFWEGKKHGQGTLYYASGTRYEGDWVDGEKHGQGTYYYADGDRYEGDFLEGKVHGQGTYYYANGNRYEGDWVDDKRTGKGIFYFTNGNRYEGDWVDDKRTGKGIYYYANGDRYEGRWAEDKKHGTGVYYYADGGSVKQVWENGTQVD